MTFTRRSGILLHPTSLPGPHGIGDLGPGAHRFIDFLADSNTQLWQVLPLGPTGYGDSPYQCFSAFAGNPYLISFENLIADDLLTAADLKDMPVFSDSKVDFGALIPWKLSILERAYKNFSAAPSARLHAELTKFHAVHAKWLDDYALFMALKEAHGGGAWDAWPEPLRKRNAEALRSARKTLQQQIARFAFYQFLFYRQWDAVRVDAQARGIQIIGDIPIFVAYDSADVWSHPNLFHLDENDRPTVVAGVPPDLFSPTGQLWGNPLYKWDAHKQDGYAWWRERMRAALQLVDIVRLDHFRGFAGHWEIPAGSPTAETGRWTPGPGADLFDALVSELRETSGKQELPLIAEDLGLITQDVLDLRERYKLPGMKIMQFGFSGPDNPFLPHNYTSNYVAYTGTHDNDTARGWFELAVEPERSFALRYMGSDGVDFAWDLVRATWASVAVFAIAPMQDLLNLSSDARMNFPSKLGGNWEWRMQMGDMTDELARKISELNFIFRR
jgi:4-alpha-glucanotransferase